MAARINPVLRLGSLACGAALFVACVSTEDIEGIKAQLSDVQRQALQIQKQGSSKQEMADLETSIAAKMTSLLKSEADMQVELRSLTSQMSELGAKLDDTNYRLAQLSQQIAATNQELKGARMSAPADPGVGSLPGGGNAPADPEALYQQAYNDYLRGNYDLAILGFRQYLEAFPGTELADNAAYWVGECYFSQRKFQAAVREFDDVLSRYPRSDKLPSAILKKGYALLELGDRAKGVVQLQHVVREYPASDEANLARQRLKSLGVDAG
jgi:tol-pal system protein YbgF